MDNVNALVKAGVPIVVAILGVALVFLFKYYEAQRKESDKDRKESDKLNRESMERMFKTIQVHQEKRDAEFVGALRDIAQEMKENRRGRSK